MHYDFTTIYDRHNMDALAVDGVGTSPGFSPDAPKEGFSFLPMWVADMNFATVPTIAQAIAKRIEHPLFGYFRPSQAYFDAIINWQRTQNGVEGLLPEHIGYENGVLGGVVSALNVFCSRGDKVLVLSPTYVGFTSSLENNGYHIIHSALKKDDAGVWRMDYADMEEKIAQHKIHATIVCSPHNPCGRVWERWELEQAMELFRKHDVMVVSDEIWSDLTLPGYQHIPTQSVSPDAKNRTIALYAPSKTFNLAGLVGSYHIVYNKMLRERLEKESSLSHYDEMNVLSMHALIGAYRPEGHEWLDELKAVLTGNVDYAYDYITGHFQGVSLAKPEGTYMLLLNCEQWCERHGLSLPELEKRGWDVGVAWQDGDMFQAPYSIRVNLALPLSRVKEAMRRLDQYVFNA